VNPKGHEWVHDRTWDPSHLTPVWYQWQATDDGGVQQVLSPAEAATGTYQRPHWIP